MKFFIKKSIISISLLLILSNAFSQQYVIDTTFWPDYDFHGMWDQFSINSIIEMEDGSIVVAGDFGFILELTQPVNVVKLLIDGSMDLSFFYEPVNIGKMEYIHNHFYHTSSAFIIKVNIFGEVDWDHWSMQNSSWGGTPTDLFIKNDSSILFSGLIISHFPSYPEREFGRLLPNGFIDTTFDHNTNDVIWEIEEYDVSRLLLTGRFTEYDSYPINKICRIYKDCTIDTTFHSILTTGPLNGGSSKPLYIQEDGKIILGGFFKTPGQTEYMYLIRLNTDGSLDSTFNNFNNVPISSGSIYTETRVVSVCLTEDNNYLIGGMFAEYQGYQCGNIVLTDHDGFIIPDGIPGIGFENDIMGQFNFPVTKIIKSADNKYYVGGTFDKFNGDSVPPLIRLKKSNVSIDFITNNNELSIYPNPVSNYLYVNSEYSINELEIYSISGKLIKEESQLTNSSFIDVSDFAEGQYFIRARGKNENYVSKFIIVR